MIMVSQDYNIKWWEDESYELEGIQSKKLGMLPFDMTVSFEVDCVCERNFKSFVMLGVCKYYRE